MYTNALGKEQLWLHGWTCTKRVCVRLSLLPISVIDGSSNITRPKLTPCTSKSPTLLGMSEPLNKEVNDAKFGCTKNV